jgi:hypothetical protein
MLVEGRRPAQGCDAGYLVMTKIAPRNLSAALRSDLNMCRDGFWSLLSSLIRHAPAKSPACLYALIDMARVPTDSRPEVTAILPKFNALPLLVDSRYEKMKEYGPFLVAPFDGDSEALLATLGGMNSDVISAWIVAKLPPDDMAAHLRQATFALDWKKVRYLLRWYDPLITPTLFRLGDAKWVEGFLSPIHSWWYPIDTPQGESWSRIEGGGDHVAPSCGTLRISEELWEALVSDPLPYQLLNYVEETNPSVFGNSCYGVRLAKVEDLLHTAKKHGLKVMDDQMIYALAMLDSPSRAQEPRWQQAMRLAVTGQAPLRAYLLS